MVPLSLPLSLSLSAANATTYGACHLFITTNQRTHPHKTDSTRARGGPKADLAVALEMEMELELRLDAVHAISAIKPRRVESHWNWRGMTGGGEGKGERRIAVTRC